MKRASAKTPRRPGRPLSFDRERALEAAMLQFWRTGYETTSVSVLTDAMGITAPSLYTAFGDKEQLFLDCLRRYTSPAWPTRETLAQAPSAREAARALLEASAKAFTRPGMPAGCLIASSAASGTGEAERVRAALRQLRRELQDGLAERVRQDIDAGLLPPAADAPSLAAMTVAVMQGLSTLARDGARQQELLSLVGTAMAAWPEATPRPRSRKVR